MSSPAAGSISEGRREACFSHWLVLAREYRRLDTRASDLSLKCRELELENEHARLQVSQYPFFFPHFKSYLVEICSPFR